MGNEHPKMILCGTDFTPAAREAAEVASAFSLATGEPLLLVHALEELEAQAASEQLETEAERLRALFAGLSVTTQLETGNADEVLTGLARLVGRNGTPGKPQVRFVILAALGRRTPLRWVLGSVAERTVENSPVPVLVVRDKLPLLAWLRGERRLKIVVGFDFSQASSLAVQWVSELSRLAPCEVLVAHVSWPPPERKWRGSSKETGPTEVMAKHEALLRNEVSRSLRKSLTKDGPLPRVCIQLSPARRAVALAELASAEKADLFVVGSRQLHGPARLWQESVSRGVLFHASMSVGCVPIAALSESSALGATTPPVDADELELLRKLEAHPFLRGLPGNQLRRIASMSREVRFGVGEVLFREGGKADTLYLIANGLVDLGLHVPGQGVVRLESLRSGDLVGFSWLFPPYRWHLDARAVEPTSVLAIDAESLRSWMEKDTGLGQQLAMRLVEQLYERLERVRMQRLDLYRVEA